MKVSSLRGRPGMWGGQLVLLLASKKTPQGGSPYTNTQLEPKTGVRVPKVARGGGRVRRWPCHHPLVSPQYVPG